MLIVIALGGNAILQRGQPLEETIQKENIKVAAKAIAQVATEHQIVLTHGNGPQVGLLALQNDAYKEVQPYTLDVLGAESEGMIGYLFEQALRNQLPGTNIVTLLTQTLVEQNDPAFDIPTKFVGPTYSERQAQDMAQQKNWTMKPDGDHYRRVVASPAPKAIVELNSIQHILSAPNTIVICTGGGGIPVIATEKGLDGVEAVVDKDLASNILAQGIKADALVMLTDVACVQTHFNQEDSKNIKQATPIQLNNYQFAQGSMGPKVTAACDFVNSGGKFAAIGALTDCAGIVAAQMGTRIVQDHSEIHYY